MTSLGSEPGRPDNPAPPGVRRRGLALMAVLVGLLVVAFLVFIFGTDGGDPYPERNPGTSEEESTRGGTTG